MITEPEDLRAYFKRVVEEAVRESENRLLAELTRRIENDNGVRYTLAEALKHAGLTVDDLEPDTPHRLWVLGPGEWSSPRCELNPYRPRPAPLLFLAGDEFNNRTLALRLPGRRLLVLNLGWPMKRIAYDPDAPEMEEST